MNQVQISKGMKNQKCYLRSSYVYSKQRLRINLNRKRPFDSVLIQLRNSLDLWCNFKLFHLQQISQQMQDLGNTHVSCNSTDTESEKEVRLVLSFCKFWAHKMSVHCFWLSVMTTNQYYHCTL